MITPFRRLPKKGRLEKTFMTVCLASFSDYPKAIVCIADKGISYGDHIQWDSDGTKIAHLNSKGTTVLFSGGEEDTARVLSGLVSCGEELGDDVNLTIKVCEREYAAARDDLIEKKLLSPNLLSRTEYLNAIKSPTLNEHILSIAKKVGGFEMDCSFLVCGFDAKNRPFILDVEPPGTATNFFTTGFHAIGSGWDKAVARFLFSEHKRTHSIHRVVYDLFDAKANAEMAAGVGYEWDVKVLYASRFVFKFDEDLKKLFERVWIKYNRSPFEKREKDDMLHPPQNWQKVFEEVSEDLAKAANSPSKDKKGWPNARAFTSSLKESKPSKEMGDKSSK